MTGDLLGSDVVRAWTEAQGWVSVGQVITEILLFLFSPSAWLHLLPVTPGLNQSRSTWTGWCLKPVGHGWTGHSNVCSILCNVLCRARRACKNTPHCYPILDPGHTWLLHGARQNIKMRICLPVDTKCWVTAWKRLWTWCLDLISSITCYILGSIKIPPWPMLSRKQELLGSPARIDVSIYLIFRFDCRLLH